MRRYFIAAALVGVSAVGYAQTSHRTIFEKWPNATWVCGGFEDHVKLTVGSHPDIILVADIPSTEHSDRKVCILAEEKSDAITVPITGMSR
ncbi:MAG: hypothetical protein ACHQX3_00570 [Nitrospirales bacterium]|jgi:hypothetical protein